MPRLLLVPNNELTFGPLGPLLRSEIFLSPEQAPVWRCAAGGEGAGDAIRLVGCKPSKPACRSRTNGWVSRACGRILTCLMGLAPMQGGPLHSDGSGSSRASSERLHAWERTGFACSGVVGLMICRSVLHGDGRPNTTTTLRPRRDHGQLQRRLLSAVYLAADRRDGETSQGLQ